MPTHDEQYQSTSRLAVPKGEAHSARVWHRLARSSVAANTGSAVASLGLAESLAGDLECRGLGDNSLVGLLVLRGVNIRGKVGFRIVSANRAVLQLSGKRNASASDLVGKTITALFPSICENDLAKAIQSVIHSGRPEVLGEIHCGPARDRSQILTIFAFPLANFRAGIALESAPKRKLTQRKLRGH